MQQDALALAYAEIDRLRALVARLMAAIEAYLFPEPKGERR
jgi:hypothetical protein